MAGSADQGQLPSFNDPPVKHVSFALLLDPLPLKTVHLGQMWLDRLREKYPETADRPSVMNQLEQFIDEPLLPQFQFQILQGVPSPHVAFSSSDGTLSLGVQNDRLTHSWDATRTDTTYPRYPALRSSFEQDAATFAEFCDKHGLGHVTLRQIEVHYNNVITSGEGWDRPGELHRVLRPWAPDFTADLGEPEDVRIAQRYLARRATGEGYARLHIAVEPHRAPDGPATMRMALTFRGVPAEFSLPGIMAFLDEGHERIVRAFTSATTPEMHQVWGRDQ